MLTLIANFTPYGLSSFCWVDTSKAPSHTAYVVRNIGEKSYFDRIGAAWENSDGNGFTIRLNALPLTGEIVIRKPKSDENGGAQ